MTDNIMPIKVNLPNIPVRVFPHTTKFSKTSCEVVNISGAIMTEETRLKLDRRLFELAEEFKLDYVIGLFGKNDMMSFTAISDNGLIQDWDAFITRDKLNLAIKMSYDNEVIDND
jgi:hypothetical protein